ncbi:MAG: hydroxymethylbilane synthase [Steroidobacteraceae bacterium]
MTTLRIATRESRLALWQAEHVAARLRAAHVGLEVILVPMTTTGDQILDRTLAQVGGKGLFVKELELALLENRADIAVHSMKDVPSELPPSLALTCMLERADPRDAFVSNLHRDFASLPQGAKVGTASLRRQSQLLALRPDLQILPLRGNVETRLRKLDEGQYAAIVLASAGLTRLGLAARITEYLDVERSVPAAGQGVVGIECRRDDAGTRALCAALNNLDAEHCVGAERAFAAKLEGSCQAPIAGFATLTEDTLTLCGVVAAPNGAQVIKQRISGPRLNCETLGVQLAEQVLALGADKLLASLRHA